MFSRVGRPTRTLAVVAATAALAGLSACGPGAPETDAGPRHVVSFPATGPTEVTPLDAATLLPETPCDPELTDRASCTPVSAAAPGTGDALATVVRTARGGITTFTMAGRDDEGAVWSLAPEAAPAACVGGPGPARFACLVSTPDGTQWVVHDVATGEEVYRSDLLPVYSPPVVTPGIESIYSVWADGSPEAAEGVILSLGPDRVRFSTEVTFAVPQSSADAGYAVEGGGEVVVTGAGISNGDGGWTRLTLDAGTGEVRDGLPGIALLDMNGLGLARDGDALLAGDVTLDAPADALVAQPAAVDDPATLPATVLLADGRVAAYSREDGSPLWETAGEFDPWAACEGVLVGAGGGALTGVDLDGGAERWSAPDAAGNVTFAWCAPGTAVVLDGARLAGYSLADGSLAWERDLEIPEGAEVVSLRPASAKADSIVLLVIGGGVAADGTLANVVLTIR